MYAPFKTEPTETRIFTPDLRGLIAWLETQDGATEYDYWNPNDCLLIRFFKVRRGDWHSAYMRFDCSIESSVAEPFPRTYAAALDRARAELAKQS